MNFPYDARVMPFIRAYISLNKPEKAKPHLEILAEQSVQFIEFFNSLDKDDIKSWERDRNFWFSAVNQTLDAVKQINDPAFNEKIESLIGKYRVGRQQIQN